MTAGLRNGGLRGCRQMNGRYGRWVDTAVWEMRMRACNAAAVRLSVRCSAGGIQDSALSVMRLMVLGSIARLQDGRKCLYQPVEKSLFTEYADVGGGAPLGRYIAFYGMVSNVRKRDLPTGMLLDCSYPYRRVSRKRMPAYCCASSYIYKK